MNCECIYYSRDTGKDKWYMNHLRSLAAIINGRGVELFPNESLSEIKEDVKCYVDYYDGGKTVTIPAGSKVLFAYGKYHYMYEIRSGRRVFHPCFPVDGEVLFEDFEDETYTKIYENTINE